MKKPLLLLLSATFLTAFLSSCISATTYDVTFKNGEGYTIVGNAKATEGENYSFTVSLSEGYEATSSFLVQANGETVNLSGNKYVVSNVTKNIEITVSGVDKITYNISFVEAKGIKFEGEKTVKYGETYSFKANVSEGYDDSSISIFYKMGDASTVSLTPEIGGLYGISNVKGNLMISANDLNLESYDVTAPEDSDKYQFSGPAKVEYGSDYRFSVTAKEGYEFSSIIAYEDEKNILTAESLGDDQYKFSSVKGSLRIVVQGVGVKNFVVNKDFDSSHYTFKGADKAVYGEDYVFELSLKGGYSKGSNYNFLVNDADPIELSSGKYVIHDVKSTPHIEAFGEEIILLNVSFSCNMSSALKNAEDKVPYFQNEYRFNVELDDKYSNSSDSMLVYSLIDGVKTKLTKNSDGSYSVSNPHKDFEIVVEGVDLNSYTVRFYNGDNKVYEAKVYDGSSLSDEQLSAAKTAYEATLGENEKFDDWEEDISSISGNMSVHGITMKAVSTASELAAMSDTGSYYLSDDIKISSPLNISSFSGRLNGLGHRVYSLSDSGKLLYSADNDMGVLFKNFSGTLRNVEIEVGICDYSTGLSGIADVMDAGLIENVIVRATYKSQLYVPSGAMVGTLNGGIIKDSAVYFVAASYDNSLEESYRNCIYPLAGSIVGGCFEHVTTYVPGDVDISSLALAKDGVSTDTVRSCSIVKHESKKLDSALLSFGAINDTYLGMPLSEGSFTGGYGTELFAALNLYDAKIDMISFFVKAKEYHYSSTEDRFTFGLDGGNELNLTTCVNGGKTHEMWNYFELRQIGDYKYRLSIIAFVDSSTAADFGNNVFVSSYIKEVTINEGDTLQSVMGKFYSWGPDSTVTLQSTPLYLSEK